MVAAHVAHGRHSWTTCRRRCTSEQCSSRLRTARTSTHETRGQACWSYTPPVAPQLCRGADPSLNNQTCSHRATPACYTFASFAFCISLAPLCEQPAQVALPPLHLLFVLPTSSESCPRAGILESITWITGDQERPFAEGSVGPRANLRKEPGRSSRDILWKTRGGPR